MDRSAYALREGAGPLLVADARSVFLSTATMLYVLDPATGTVQFVLPDEGGELLLVGSPLYRLGIDALATYDVATGRRVWTYTWSCGYGSLLTLMIAGSSGIYIALSPSTRRT